MISDDLLRICNGGVPEWAHISEGESAMSPGYLEAVRDDLLRVLRKRILIVDERPTLTRMFTFTEHMNCFLLLQLMGLLPNLIKMRGTQPRERNRKRVDKVLAFMQKPDADQYLRRTCLSLQIAAHVNALCAQLREGEPLLVRISKGAVQQAVVQDCARLLGQLH